MIRYSYSARRRRRASEKGRRMAEARWRKDRMEREHRPPSPSWETIVARAKQDRKGATICTHYVMHRGELRVLEIRWSLHGRVSQWDALVDGRRVMTAGQRAILRRWPCLGWINGA